MNPGYAWFEFRTPTVIKDCKFHENTNFTFIVYQLSLYIYSNSHMLDETNNAQK